MNSQKNITLPNKILIAIMIAFLAYLGALFIAQIRFVINTELLADDAYIYLRYSENFLQGQGLVWNRGEMPVEGFTSTLYQFMLIGFEALGISSFVSIPVVGTLSSVLALFLAWLIARRLNPSGNVENVLAVLLTGVSPVFLCWTNAGLETPVYTAFLLLAVFSYLGNFNNHSSLWKTGLLFALTAYARPEGLALFVFTLAFDWILSYSKERKWVNKSTLMMLAGFIVIFAPIFIWKWIYFGYPFPNTYYAKANGGGMIQVMGGVNYLLSTINLWMPGISLNLIFLVLVVKKIRREDVFTVEKVYVFSLLAAALGVVLINGGDHAPCGRFLMGPLPLIYILGGAIALSLIFRAVPVIEPLKPLFIVIALIITIFNTQPWTYFPAKNATANLPPPDATRLDFYQNSTTGFLEMGETLAEIGSEDQTIAIIPVGAIAYYSKMKVIDMTGLVDPVIAHEPFDPAYIASWRPGHDKGDGLYVLDRKPDYIQLVDFLTTQPFEGLDENSKQYKSIVEIWASEDFHENYEFHPIQTKSGWYYNLYRRVAP